MRKTTHVDSLPPRTIRGRVNYTYMSVHIHTCMNHTQEGKRKEVAVRNHQSPSLKSLPLLMAFRPGWLTNPAGEKYLRRGHTGDCDGKTTKDRHFIGHHPTKPENKPQKEPLRDILPRQAGFFRPVPSSLSLPIRRLCLSLIKY